MKNLQNEVVTNPPRIDSGWKGRMQGKNSRNNWATKRLLLTATIFCFSKAILAQDVQNSTGDNRKSEMQSVIDQRKVSYPNTAEKAQEERMQKAIHPTYDQLYPESEAENKNFSKLKKADFTDTTKKYIKPSIADLYYYSLASNHKNWRGLPQTVDTQKLIINYINEVARENIMKLDEFDRRRKINEYKDRLIFESKKVNHKTEFISNYVVDYVKDYDFDKKQLPVSLENDFTILASNTADNSKGYFNIVFENSPMKATSFNIPLGEIEAEIVVKALRQYPSVYKIMGVRHYKITDTVIDCKYNDYLVGQITTVEYFLIKVKHDSNGSVKNEFISKLAEVLWPLQNYPHTDLRLD